MYAPFLILTFLTSLTTAARLSSDSSVLVTWNRRDLVGNGKSTAEGKQARIDERISSPSQGATQMDRRQLQVSDEGSRQKTSNDENDQYSSGMLAEAFGTRIINRSVNELSMTVFKWVKSTANSSVEKHARHTIEGLSPKSRTYWRYVVGARSGSRGKGEAESNESLAQGKANGVPDGGNNNNNNNNNGAESGVHVANVDGQANGFGFGQARRFPHKWEGSIW